MDDDVERLFSWIKTPEIRYRDFAGERDVASAADTWPAQRPAAPATIAPEAAPTAERPTPGGRAGGVFSPRRAAPPPADEPAPPARDARPIYSDATADVPWAPDEPQGAVFAHLEPALVRPEAAPPQHAAPAGSAAPAPPQGRAGLFAGVEDGSERPPAPSSDAAAPSRSLEAVFTRLAKPAQADRDEPREAAGSGLGSVFRRLR